MMTSMRQFFLGPTLQEQHTKCKVIARKNRRSLDRSIQNLEILERKTRTNIIQASKRGQRNPAQAKQAAYDARTLAKEVVRMRQQRTRLETSKATLTSVEHQIDQRFAMLKVKEALGSAAGIMKDVNTLIKLPELTGTMRELSQELTKSGIIGEMTEDMMPDSDLLEGEDEEVDVEVDKVLSEVLKNRVQAPETQVPQENLPIQPEEEELNSEEMLAHMRGRLEALKS